MKNSVLRPESLEELLNKELNVLGNLYACQKRMYEYVIVRDWVMLQKEIFLSGKMTEIFLDLEKCRENMQRQFCSDSEGIHDFYQITIAFPEPLRSKTNARFRELKRLLLLSKTENEVLNTYISNIRTYMTGMLETIMPERRNKIYNRRGALTPVKMESVVLNRSF